MSIRKSFQCANLLGLILQSSSVFKDNVITGVAFHNLIYSSRPDDASKLVLDGQNDTHVTPNVLCASCRTWYFPTRQCQKEMLPSRHPTANVSLILLVSLITWLRLQYLLICSVVFSSDAGAKSTVKVSSGRRKLRSGQRHDNFLH